MIQNLKIRNFKSLQNVDLELKNLNLLTGLNGSGKSTLIQALLLLRQSKDTESGDYLGTLYLRGNLFSAHTIQEVLSSQIQEKRLSFELGFDKEENPLTIYSSEITDASRDSIEIQNANAKNQLSIGWLTKHSLFNNKFQYLFTERQNYSDEYLVSVKEVNDKNSLGIHGEHTTFFLHTYGSETEVKNPILHHPKAESSNLIDQVDAWLSEISPNTKVKTFLKSQDYVELRYNQGDYAYKPKHMGFGLSYALPVITTLLTAKENKLIIIENPESHIHPRGQSKLGRLLALAAEAGAQLIIETHSDHILNGIRLAVAEKQLSLDKQKIFFFERNADETSSTIKEIRLRENGFIDNWEEGFFDQFNLDLKELFKLKTEAADASVSE